MTAAALALGAGGGTREERMAKIIKARQYNASMGGPFLAPWDLDQVPEEWILTLDALSSEIPKIREGYRELDAAFEAAAAKHRRK